MNKKTYTILLIGRYDFYNYDLLASVFDPVIKEKLEEGYEAIRIVHGDQKGIDMVLKSYVRTNWGDPDVLGIEDPPVVTELGYGLNLYGYRSLAPSARNQNILEIEPIDLVIQFPVDHVSIELAERVEKKGLKTMKPNV